MLSRLERPIFPQRKLLPSHQQLLLRRLVINQLVQIRLPRIDPRCEPKAARHSDARTHLSLHHAQQHLVICLTEIKGVNLDRLPRLCLKRVLMICMPPRCELLKLKYGVK